CTTHSCRRTRYVISDLEIVVARAATTSPISSSSAASEVYKSPLSSSSAAKEKNKKQQLST
ncbi:hypothetical protein KYX74_03905, partial [Enterococcus lactis]|uniref:hypothetical protein n=1 Tax=Enterococcus lactis TaxID=357441 RepID=UPI001C7CCB81